MGQGGERERQNEKDQGERSCIGQEGISEGVSYLAEMVRAKNRLRVK